MNRWTRQFLPALVLTALCYTVSAASADLQDRKDVIVSCDFEVAEWWREWGLKGKPANCALVEGKSALGGKGKSLKVTIPKGATTGANFHFRFQQQLGREPEEIYFRYYLKFDPDWKNASDGGKLPGFSATYGKAGWGGRKVHGTDGWSARGHFKKPGADAVEIGYYCYHADMKSKYGDVLKFNPILQYDRWYCIEMYCKLNSLGKEGEPGKKDGILRAWIDGEPAYARTDLRFRDVAKLKIESIWINVYHGGTKQAPQDLHCYLDNIAIARKPIRPAQSDHQEVPARKTALASAQELTPVPVEGQPLAANVKRVLQALEYLGASLPNETHKALKAACDDQDTAKIQRLLDPHVLLAVHLNPEVRVKVARGPAKATLQQAGYTPILVKVTNDSTASKPLRISSPQAGPPYAGMAHLSMTRQDQMHLLTDPKYRPEKERFLHVEMFTNQPMTPNLSGLKVEYAIALVYSSAAGKREATIGFDVGQGTQDLGFRAEMPVLFDVRPAVPVKLAIADHDGKPTVGRFTFRDKAGHVHPQQARRLTPDLFFQEQIYRNDGDLVLLPPGELTMYYSRGPEYRLLKKTIVVPAKGEGHVCVKLQRWIDTAAYGFFSGDHHIHAAGCAHYTIPTEGVMPRDMYLQVKGEGLNVGCLLTWGPCYDFQRQFFEPAPHKLSESLTVLKYDIEVSGFGSQALGHVCLLNLRDQTYPGSRGTKDKGWPTWTTPVLRWAKSQGAITGYAHSASGLQIDPAAATKRLLAALDKDDDGKLNRQEAKKGLLPGTFERSDTDGDGFLTAAELVAAHQRAAGWLPNLAIPELNSVGAQEIFVTTPQGLCDFISAMDTARIPEWNCWYHLLNCGFPLKVSGETDFPCMSGSRVGQGRVYVQLGKVTRVDFTDWCTGLAKGRSYVSDGYAHALEFTVDGKAAGHTVELENAGAVTVKAKVAFASETPLGIAHGGELPREAAPWAGDTVTLHGPRHPDEARRQGGLRRVELVVNGKVIASKDVPADDRIHDVDFNVPIERSSWVALRNFPQLHTNPVTVRVAGQPIRASRESALWCAACIEQLWRARGKDIHADERETAHTTFLKVIEVYRKIAAEAPRP